MTIEQRIQDTEDALAKLADRLYALERTTVLEDGDKDYTLAVELNEANNTIARLEATLKEWEQRPADEPIYPWEGASESMLLNKISHLEATIKELEETIDEKDARIELVNTLNDKFHDANNDLRKENTQLVDIIDEKDETIAAQITTNNLNAERWREAVIESAKLQDIIDEKDEQIAKLLALIAPRVVVHCGTWSL